ncbi:DUF1449 domain-containing protein [Motiliproteus sp. MSK22-1]|nr:DUF1449 domain-containing protein [Motiliproteus sp. MSK22-1]
MDPFYQNISSFPTVFFTFILSVCLLYWLVAVLGFADIDILDFDLPDVEGGLPGSQGSGFSAADTLAGLMLKLGLNGVPVTIIVSFIALIGWLLSYFTVHFLFGIVPDGILRYLFGLLVVGGVLYAAAMITSVIIRPLRPLFKQAQQETHKYVLGQVAIVRTSRVDNSFGEATLDDGGAGLILKVRSFGDTVFKKGDRVVLLEYVKEEYVYRVISEAEFSHG